MANGHGGARPGAGRKSHYHEVLHSLPDATELIMRGLTPIEIMVISMRRDWERALQQQETIANKSEAKPDELQELYRLEAVAFDRAEKCAPYIHPKLTAVKQEGGDGSSLGNGGIVLQLAEGDEDL